MQEADIIIYCICWLKHWLSAEEKILQWAEDGFTTVHAARPLFYPCQCDRKKTTHLYKTYPRSLWLAWAKTWPLASRILSKGTVVQGHLAGTKKVALVAAVESGSSRNHFLSASATTAGFFFSSLVRFQRHFSFFCICSGCTKTFSSVPQTLNPALPSQGRSILSVCGTCFFSRSFFLSLSLPSPAPLLSLGVEDAALCTRPHRAQNPFGTPVWQ